MSVPQKVVVHGMVIEAPQADPNSPPSQPHAFDSNISSSNKYEKRNGYNIEVLQHSVQNIVTNNIAQPEVETAFSEMVEELPKDRSRPLVVLDCANIGWMYGNNQRFSAAGVQLAVASLQKLNIDIKAFIPIKYISIKPRRGQGDGNIIMETSDWEDLTVLVSRGVISVVPAGDHDDSYILHFARSAQGFIVSNDLFRDHLESMEVDSVRLSMQLWLRENRCGYAFVDNDFIFNPSSTLSYTLQRHAMYPQTAPRPEASMEVDDHRQPHLGPLLQVFSRSMGASNIISPLLTIIDQLTETAEALHSLHRPWELKHLLIVRAKLLVECAMIEQAVECLMIILQRIDGEDEEAKQLLQLITTQRNSNSS